MPIPQTIYPASLVARVVHNLSVLPAKLGVYAMAPCEHCGNDYDKAFEVTLAGEVHIFDSFECAIHSLAPECAHCGCKVIGHGVESNGVFYCCAHCVSQEGVRSSIRE